MGFGWLVLVFLKSVSRCYLVAEISKTVGSLELTCWQFCLSYWFCFVCVPGMDWSCCFSIRSLEIRVVNNFEKGKNAVLVQHKATQDRLYTLFHMKPSCFWQCVESVTFRQMLLGCTSRQVCPA